MNKHCFRLIFSTVVGCLIPVAETTRARRKPGQQPSALSPETGTSPPVFSLNTLLFSLLLACFPGWAAADILVDPNRSSGTTVVSAPNGMPVIEIANPNGNGLSHNRFTEFDVQKPGAIFNNSLVNGQSQLGGAVLLNPNLQREATAILTEVTGNGPSSINGTLEVFGGKADLLIANLVKSLSRDGTTHIDKVSLVGCGTACAKDGPALGDHVDSLLQHQGVATQVKGYATSVLVDERGRKKPTVPGVENALGKSDPDSSQPSQDAQVSPPAGQIHVERGLPEPVTAEQVSPPLSEPPGASGVSAPAGQPNAALIQSAGAKRKKVPKIHELEAAALEYSRLPSHEKTRDRLIKFANDKGYKEASLRKHLTGAYEFRSVYKEFLGVDQDVQSDTLEASAQPLSDSNKQMSDLISDWILTRPADINAELALDYVRRHAGGQVNMFSFNLAFRQYVGISSGEKTGYSMALRYAQRDPTLEKMTILDYAKATGVPEGTVYNWLYADGSWKKGRVKVHEMVASFLPRDYKEPSKISVPEKDYSVREPVYEFVRNGGDIRNEADLISALKDKGIGYRSSVKKIRESMVGAVEGRGSYAAALFYDNSLKTSGPIPTISELAKTFGTNPASIRNIITRGGRWRVGDPVVHEILAKQLLSTLQARVEQPSGNSEAPIDVDTFADTSNPLTIKQEPEIFSEPIVDPSQDVHPTDAPVKEEEPVIRHTIDNRAPVLQGQNGEDILFETLQPPNTPKHKYTNDLNTLIDRQKITFSYDVKQSMQAHVEGLAPKKKFIAMNDLRQRVTEQAKQLLKMTNEERASYMESRMAAVEVPGKGRGAQAVRDIDELEVLAPYAGRRLTGNDAVTAEYAKYGEVHVNSYAFGTKYKDTLISAFGEGGNITSLINEDETNRNNNVGVFRLGSYIPFFITTKPVVAGQELLLHYGPQYNRSGWAKYPVEVSDTDSSDGNGRETDEAHRPFSRPVKRTADMAMNTDSEPLSKRPRTQAARKLLDSPPAPAPERAHAGAADFIDPNAPPLLRLDPDED